MWIEDINGNAINLGNFARLEPLSISDDEVAILAYLTLDKDSLFVTLFSGSRRDGLAFWDDLNERLPVAFFNSISKKIEDQR